MFYGDYKGVCVTAWPLGSATASRSDTGQITTAEQNTKPRDKYVHLQKTVPTAPKTGPAPRYLIGLPALSCLGRLHGLGAIFFFFSSTAEQSLGGFLKRAEDNTAKSARHSVI